MSPVDQVQNNECQTVRDKNSNKWPSQTAEGDWKSITVDLKSGMNVLIWKVMGMGTSSHRIIKPVLIKEIEIYGKEVSVTMAGIDTFKGEFQPMSNLDYWDNSITAFLT